MDDTKQEKLKKVLKKAVDIKNNSNLAMAREFVDLDDKIEDKFEELGGKVALISEELKKKLENELVLEIDREELKGEDGKDYILTDKDKKEIASSISVPIVEKIIEKREIIKEQPIIYKNITNEIKEVAKYEEREQIVTKINSGKDKDVKIEAKQIIGLPEFTREVVREVGSVGHIETQLKAGTGVTITTDGSGAKVISSTGGGESLWQDSGTEITLVTPRDVNLGTKDFTATTGYFTDMVIGQSHKANYEPPANGLLVQGDAYFGNWAMDIPSNSPYRMFSLTTDNVSAVLHLANDYSQSFGAGLRLYNYASAEYMTSGGNLGFVEFSANKELVTTLTEEVVGAKITSDSDVDWSYGPGDAQYSANLKFYTSTRGALAERGRFHGNGDFEIFGTGKVISPNIVSPIILGGTSTTQDLTFQTTSGVGASGADMHFLVGNNGVTEAMTILNNGNVGIGQIAPNAKLHVVSADGRVVNFNSTVTDLSGNIIGALNTLNVIPPSSSTATYYANYNQLIADGTLSNSNSVLGVFSKVIHQTSGTLGIVTAGEFQISNTSTGTITQAYGLRIAPPSSNSGTITNTTGLHISSQTIGTQTNTPYGLYQAGASDINYFAGNVGIGDTSPSVRLEVGVVADGTVATLNGGASGANLLTLNRNSGGVVQAYGLALASGKLVFQDITNTQYIFYSTYANFGGLGNLPTLNIGPYEPNNTSVGATGLLKARGAGSTGTNTAGGNLYIASGVGRGDGTQSQINFYTPNKVGSGTSEQTYGTAKMVILGSGNVGIGQTSPTAILHLKAGTATANTAPLKFASGTSLTATEAGAVEFTTDDLFFTITTGTARKRLLMADAVGGLTSGKIPVATTNGRLIDVTPQTELTDELTTITFTAPGTPDYAIQDLTSGGYGFVTKDEGNTVLSVIANLQARVNELETKLVALGLLADAD